MADGDYQQTLMQDMEPGKWSRKYGKTIKVYALTEADVAKTVTSAYKEYTLCNPAGATHRCLQFGRLTKPVRCKKGFSNFKGGKIWSAGFEITDPDEKLRAKWLAEAMRACVELDEDVHWNATIIIKEDGDDFRAFIYPQIDPADVMRPTKGGDLVSICERTDVERDEDGNYVLEGGSIKRYHEPCGWEELADGDGCCIKVRLAALHEKHKDAEKKKDDNGNIVKVPGYDYAGFKAWLYYCGIVPSQSEEPEDEDHVNDDDMDDEMREAVAAQRARLEAEAAAAGSSAGGAGGAGGSDSATPSPETDVDATIQAAVAVEDATSPAESSSENEQEGSGSSSDKSATKRRREPEDEDEESGEGDDAPTELPAGLAEDAGAAKKKKKSSRSKSRDRGDGDAAPKKKKKRHNV